MRFVVGLWFLWALASSPASASPQSSTQPSSQPATQPSLPTSASTIDASVVHLAVEPEHVVAGEAGEAWIAVDVTRVDGAAIDVGLPLLTTSTGRVDRATRTGPGRFRARFTPPPEAYPHVALVAAVVDVDGHTAVGFAGVRLWGRGQTSVKTKPGARVTVRVGADAFGPVVAGDDGNATVPIVVPPGPEHAVATSVDPLGNESTKAVDLAVPPFNRVALRVLDDVLVSGQGARALVLAVDKKGAPLVGARFVFVLDGAPLAAKVAPLSPGMYLATWTTSSARAGVARVGVALADAPVSRASADVRVLAADPAHATIALSTAQLTADDERAVGVRIAVVDAAGAPLPPGVAHVGVDVGYVDAVASTAAERTLAWVVPAKTTTTAATLSVRAPSGVVIGEARLSLARGQVSRLAFSPVADVAADGRTGVDVDVAAFDAAGNEVAPTGVVLTSPAGKFFGAHVDADARRLRARFVPDAVGAEGVAVVSARVGTVTANVDVVVRVAPRAALVVSPMLASSFGTGGVASLGPEVSVLARLPVLDGAVYAGADAGALFGVGSTTTSYASLRMVPVLAEVAWRPLAPVDVPAGSGAGVHVGAQAGVVVVDVVVDGERIVVPAGVGAAVLGAYLNAGPGSVDVAVRLGLGVPLGGRLPGFAAPPFGPGVVVGYRLGF